MGSITYEKARKIIADKDIKVKKVIMNYVTMIIDYLKPEILFKGQFKLDDYLGIKEYIMI